MKKITASLFGLAFGDAFAATTEFLSIPQILQSYPPAGPTDLPQGPVAAVTDDTQMTIALGQALVEVAPHYTPEDLDTAIRTHFVRWLRDPQNNRAPGMTCIRACEILAMDQPWYKASQMKSKGCGANMRVAPVAYLLDLSSEQRAALAQYQAAFTHGHPTALAAADLTAYAQHALLTGTSPAKLLEVLRTYAESQQAIYHETWLGPLWQQSYHPSAEAYISYGWQECLHALERLENALQQPDYETDPCLQTGEGWIAEEALMTGLLCFLLYPKEPLKALQRAAVTAGDSDSIACLTGSFAGAHLGASIWPEEWYQRIEYAGELSNLAHVWERNE